MSSYYESSQQKCVRGKNIHDLKYKDFIVWRQGLIYFNDYCKSYRLRITTSQHISFWHGPVISCMRGDLDINNLFPPHIFAPNAYHAERWALGTLIFLIALCQIFCQLCWTGTRAYADPMPQQFVQWLGHTLRSNVCKNQHAYIVSACTARRDMWWGCIYAFTNH